jgi:hypothetical protein
MNDDSTGSQSAPTVSPRHDPSIVSSGSVSGDAYAPTLATAGTRSTGATSLQPVRAKRSASQAPKVVPKVKHACYAFFNACRDNLDRALDHDEEFFLRNNALEQVKDTLTELWGVRSQREEQFGEVVNMLQGIFAQRTVEDFTTHELHCLRSVFARLCDEPVYDDDIANEITVELLNGGIDAFREIE